MLQKSESHNQLYDSELARHQEELKNLEAELEGSKWWRRLDLEQTWLTKMYRVFRFRQGPH